MPFTPYHLGPALLFGVILFPLFDIAAFAVASIVLDIEPFLVIYLSLDLPLHWVFHSYLGATLVAIPTSLIMWWLRNPIKSLLEIFGITQKTTFPRTLLASIAGTYSHVFLDSFLYTEMNPFLPFLGNPFYGLYISSAVYQFCLICGVIGFFVYLIRFFILPAMNRRE